MVYNEKGNEVVQCICRITYNSIKIYIYEVALLFDILARHINRKTVGIIIDHSEHVDVAVVGNFSKEGDVKVQTSNERKGKANTTMYCSNTLYNLQVYESNLSYQSIKHTIQLYVLLTDVDNILLYLH